MELYILAISKDMTLKLSHVTNFKVLLAAVPMGFRQLSYLRGDNFNYQIVAKECCARNVYFFKLGHLPQTIHHFAVEKASKQLIKKYRPQQSLSNSSKSVVKIDPA